MQFLYGYTTGLKPGSELKQDDIHTALNVAVQMLRHLCGENTRAVEDLLGADALGSLVHLAQQAPKPYTSRLSRWIETHAVDVLLLVVQHGMSKTLAKHLRQHDLLLPILEGLVTVLGRMQDARETPNLLGVVGLFKVLMQSCVAASAAGEHDFVEYVRGLDLEKSVAKKAQLLQISSSKSKKSQETSARETSAQPGSLSHVWSDAQRVPLILALLKHYIVELCGAVYPEGKFAQEQHLPKSRRAGEWGEMRGDESMASVQVMREFKARRLAHELSAAPALELARDEAMRQLEASEWVVEEAARQLRSMAQTGTPGKLALSASPPEGGLGMRLILPDNTAPDAPAAYFVVSKVMEDGPAFRSSAVHVGDRLLKVDGLPCSGMTLDALALRLKGPVGTQVTLVLQAECSLQQAQDGLRPRVRIVSLLRSALVPAPVSQVHVTDQDKEQRVREVVERLKGSVNSESAWTMLQKCQWDVERGVLRCQVLPHSQAVVHLLDIARELVFVGADNVHLVNAPVRLADKSGGQAQGLDSAQVEDAEGEEGAIKMPGRQVRDVQALELLSELWTWCRDDEVRLQLLETGMVIYASHPLNFFAVQQSSLMSLAIDSLEVVGPAVRLSVLRVLEYVLTVEQYLPLEHLCRLTRNLEAQVWRKSTASLVLNNVIKWLQFDSRLVAVFSSTGLLDLLIRQCRELSSSLSMQRRAHGITHKLSPPRRAAVSLVEKASIDTDVFAEALEREGVVAGDGSVPYEALAKHIRHTVHFESLSPELVDLAEEEAAVVLDRIWAAVNPDHVLTLVPVVWHATCGEIVDFLRRIDGGDSVGMACVEPALIGELALGISRAYVHALKAVKSLNFKSAKSLNTGLHTGSVCGMDAASVRGNGVEAVRGTGVETAEHQPTSAPCEKQDCMICPRTFPVVIDTILALITEQSVSVTVAREQGLVESLLMLAPILEWRDGALRVLERIILQDACLVGHELSGLLTLLSASDPTDLELREDILQFVLKLAYAHPGVRSQLRAGWMVQAAAMLHDLDAASDSTWGMKLHMAEMLVTFICLGMASSETHRTTFWTELGTSGLAGAFEGSTLMSVGNGLTVLGMLLSISVSRHVVPEAMLHGGADADGSRDKGKRHWHGIGQSVDASTETAVFINRWGDHSEVTEQSWRVRNPDAAVMAMLLINLVHADVQGLAARAMLRLVRASSHNARALTEAGFVSALLDRFSDSLLGSGDKVLEPVLRDIVVHAARQRLSVKDMHHFLASLPHHFLASLARYLIPSLFMCMHMRAHAHACARAHTHTKTLRSATC
jgi:hypothetical protein